MNGKGDRFVMKQRLQNVHCRFQKGRISVSTVQLFQSSWMLEILHNRMLENNVHTKKAGCRVPGTHAQDGKKRTLIVPFETVAHRQTTQHCDLIFYNSCNYLMNLSVALDLCVCAC